MNRFSACFVVLCLVAPLAADWPAFRGPTSNGIATDAKVPLQWSHEKNVKWKATLPQASNGSPIVSKGCVFLTTVEDEAGQQRSLYCFDRNSGEKKWVKTITYTGQEPTHKTNPHGSSTPAANGERIVVWHGSAGLYCYDFSGNELWKQELGEFKHMWGYGSSPVIHQDRVVLHSGPGKKVFVWGFDLKTGTKVWEHEEPVEGNGEFRPDKGYTGSWSSPFLTNFNGQATAICMLPTRVVGFDPQSGDLLWFCEGLRGPKGNLAYSSPVMAGEVCVCVGGFNGPSLGFKLGGSGDITAQRLWLKETNPQSIGSGVVVDGFFYRPNAGPGTVECLDPNSGEIKWTGRAEEFWGSIVYAAGHCFVTAQSGNVFVFKPSPEKWDLLYKNVMGEGSNATPAISEGQIFIRTHKQLYCIAE